MPEEATQERQATGRQRPFGVRIDHPRNCDVVIQSIPGAKLRSDIRPSRTVIDARTGEKRVPTDQARHLGQLGDVPGQEIHVNPSRREYTIHDPLTDTGGEETLGRVKRYMDENSGMRGLADLKGVPDQKGTLDEHRMKTLCRELYWLVQAGEARVVAGTLDSEETEEQIGDYVMKSTAAIDKLPGDYLLNPGSTIANTQPRFEKDYDDYVRRLNKTG